MEEFIEKLESIYTEDVQTQNYLAKELLSHYDSLKFLLEIIQNETKYDNTLITYATANIYRICEKKYFEETEQYSSLFTPIIEIYYSTPNIHKELLRLYLRISNIYSFTSSIIIQYFIENSKNISTVERAFYSFPTISHILRENTLELCDDSKENAFEIFFKVTFEYLQQEQLSNTILCIIYDEIHGFFQNIQFKEYNLEENPVFEFSFHILSNMDLNSDSIDVFLSIVNFYYEISIFGIPNEVALDKIRVFIKDNLELLIEKFKGTKVLFKILKIINRNFSKYRDFYLEKLNDILVLLINCANISEFDNDFINNPAVFYGNTYEAPDDSKYLTERCYVYIFLQSLATPEISEDLLNLIWNSVSESQDLFQVESLLYLLSSLFEKFGNTEFYSEKIPIIFQFYNDNLNNLLLCSLVHFTSKTIQILRDDYVKFVFNLIINTNVFEDLIWYLVFSNFIISIISQTNFEVPFEIIQKIYTHEDFANNTISVRLISAIVGNKQYNNYIFELVNDESDLMKDLLNIMIEKDNSKDDDITDINYHDILDGIKILVQNFGSNYISDDCNGEIIARAMLDTVCTSIICMDEAMTVLSYVFYFCEPKAQIFMAIAENLSSENIIPSDLEQGKVLTTIYKYYTKYNVNELQTLINYCQENDIFDFESYIEFSDDEISIIDY